MKLFLFIVFCLLLHLVRTECSKGMDWQSNCYIFYTSQISPDPRAGFAKAEKTCLDAGGHLASINDAFTNSLIAQSGKLFDKTFWIGANNFVIKENWTWSDGTPLNYTNWKTTEEKNISNSQSCVTLNVNDGYCWTTENCFQPKEFICAISENRELPPTFTSRFFYFILSSVFILMFLKKMLS